MNYHSRANLDMLNLKKLVEDAGIVRQKFVHGPSKWDLENPKSWVAPNNSIL